MLTAEEKKILNEKRTAINRKNNIKLYPIYKALGFDTWFYFAISVSYYIHKGLSSSEIMLRSAFFALFSILFQPVANFFTEKFGKRNTIIIGNIIVIVSMIVLILAQHFWSVLIFVILNALGFDMKYIAESNLLYDSFAEGPHRREAYSRTEQKGYTAYCVFQALSSIAAGFLFNINADLPIYCGLIVTVIATLISFSFTEILPLDKKPFTETRKYFKHLFKKYKKINKSNRLRALLLITGIGFGLLYVSEGYELQLFDKIGVNPTIVGILYAVMIAMRGIGAKIAGLMNRKAKNRTLTYILEAYAINFFLGGIVALLNIPIEVKIALLGILYAFYSIHEGAQHVLERRYLFSFSNDSVESSISSIKSITDNIIRMIVSVIASGILLFADIRYAFLIMGVIAVVLILIGTAYGKTRLGLQPEEYTKKDKYE